MKRFRLQTLQSLIASLFCTQSGFTLLGMAAITKEQLESSFLMEYLEMGTMIDSFKYKLLESFSI